MDREIILYNLRDDVTETDYIKWCEDYKGPVMLGVKSGRAFTLLRLLDGAQGDGQNGVDPVPAKPPFRFIGIMEVDDLDTWAKDTEASHEFSEEFAVQWFTEWVADFYAVGSEQVYYRESD